MMVNLPTFSDDTLNTLVQNLAQAIAAPPDDEQQLLQAQQRLDAYLKDLYEGPGPTPGFEETRALKQLIDELTEAAVQKRQQAMDEIRRQKSNNKAIAKYRSL
ncbi:hypothetical protein [Pseudoalteromonas sp. BDTF-M6]|uniref:hypothetical protein n=1 Tax=Pseudoalteromonas sp. BDTF-M6 TaxID=2796132 RepID=UPI001BB0A0E3|nr:hypothetical protein [Pseudoalteromonas sp. BDTF-M6]MBS3798798.1 hypothetical protein [Pseudoalteromonas sp. BDTF-M6]